jgi:HAD superfamily hydrolase (TIGR01509 family)
MVIKAVFVDFWGTLFKLNLSTEEYLYKRSTLFKNVLSNLGYNFSVDYLKDRYQLIRTVTDNVRRTLNIEIPLLVEIQSLVKILGINDENGLIKKKLVNVYKKLLIKHLKPVSDAEYFLSELKRMNLLLALISNTTDSKILKTILKKYGFDKYFNLMIFSDKVGHRKPHKVIYERALKKFHIKPEECIMIGDEDVDSIGAKALGIISINLNSNVNADYNVANLSEAYHIIKNLR